MSDLYALFVTTATSEPTVNVHAWQQSMGPARHVTFDINGPNNDIAILAAAEEYDPDVIFYTGGESGAGLPTDDTLRALRKFAPSVILQGDMGDPPWWPMLEHYRATDCFDLFVGMDGVKDAPIDHATLTPVDMEPWNQKPRKKSIHCGFAGNHVSRDRYETLRHLYGTEDPRSAVLHQLGDLVQLREREMQGQYMNYAAFLRRCRLSINTSWAGSGLAHHVKGRVIESAFAGCGLLEMRDSPTKEWFPEDSFFTYGSVEEARDIILTASWEEIERRAALMTAHARAHYTPKHIYGGIVERLGL